MIDILDESVPQVAEIETYVRGGKVEYKLTFKCAHENVQVRNGEILCTDCNNRDLSPEQEVSLLMSYQDAREAVAIDGVIQDE